MTTLPVEKIPSTPVGRLVPSYHDDTLILIGEPPANGYPTHIDIDWALVLDFGENFVLGSCEVLGEPAALWTTEVIRDRPKARSTCYSLQATSDPSSFDFEGVNPSLELLTADRLLIRLSEVDGDLRIVRLSESCLAWLSPGGGLLAFESTLSGDPIRE